MNPEKPNPEDRAARLLPLRPHSDYQSNAIFQRQTCIKKIRIHTLKQWLSGVKGGLREGENVVRQLPNRPASDQFDETLVEKGETDVESDRKAHHRVAFLAADGLCDPNADPVLNRRAYWDGYNESARACGLLADRSELLRGVRPRTRASRQRRKSSRAALGMAVTGTATIVCGPYDRLRGTCSRRCPMTRTQSREVKHSSIRSNCRFDSHFWDFRRCIIWVDWDPINMIGGIKRLSGYLVNYQRDQWFAMRRHRPGGNSVLWFPNMVIFRSNRTSEGNPKKGLKALILSIGPFFVTFSLFAASLELPTGLNLLAFLISPLLGLLLLVGVVKGRRDFKRFRRVQNLQQSPSAETATEAVNYLDTYQSITRRSALQTILPVCSGTPGKLVKHLTTDISVFANVLVDRLKEENQEIRRNAAAVIKWFTRDYGRAFSPHARLMSEMLKQPDSEIQADLAIALSNIGATSNNPVSFAKALTHAVKDEDPDVRQAAAVALRNLRCDRSVRMLKHLANDSSPEVRQQAQESLQALTA